MIIIVDGLFMSHYETNAVFHVWGYLEAITFVDYNIRSSQPLFFWLGLEAGSVDTGISWLLFLRMCELCSPRRTLLCGGAGRLEKTVVYKKALLFVSNRPVFVRHLLDLPASAS
jgi:hypothetical protein